MNKIHSSRLNNKDKIQVAVVEDNEYLCQAVSRLLAASGIQSTTYTSAEAFLDDQAYLEADCLILDVQLGGLSGLDLHRHLIALQKTVPVIFITAHDEPESREQAQKLGVAAYFRKTEAGQVVIEAIRRAVSVTGPKSKAAEPGVYA